MDTIKTTGTIITFYSYKGGTGRSMALANVACLIARDSQKKVLVIDWDLEAPGLHRFFSDQVDAPENKNHSGLIELFIALRDLFNSNKKLYSKLVKENDWKLLDKHININKFIVFNVQPGVDLIKAGNLDTEYPKKSTSFDWGQFFTKYNFAVKLLSEIISNKYDYCLIDSRTGLTDTSGICSTLLPEKLVLVFTPNKQSLFGVLDVAERAVDYRSSSDDLRPLSIFPLPSRVDDAEEELRKEWRSEYQIKFEELFAKCYELNECDLSDYFDEVKLPYKSYYGYGEKIAVLLERDEALSLHRAYKNFYDSLINANQIWATPDDPMSIVQKGQAFESQGKYSEALQIYQQGLIEFEKINDKEGQSIVFHSLGIVYQKLANYHQAIESFNQALSLASQIANKFGQAVVLHDLGRTHQQMGRFDDAVNFLQKSHDLFGELGDNEGKAMVLNSLGDVFQRQGKFDEAVSAFQRSLEIQSELSDESGQAITLTSLGNVWQRQGNFDDAVNALTRSCDLFAKNNDERGQATALNSLGGVLQRQGKFHEAVDVFQSCLKILSKLGDDYGLALAWKSLGDTLRKQNKHDEAINAFYKSLEVESKLGNERAQALIWNSLGFTLQRQNKLDEAVTAFQKSLLVAEKIGDERNLGMILISLGRTLQQQGKFEQAEEIFHRSYNLFERLNDDIGLAAANYNIGRLYVEQNKLELARHHLIVSFEDYWEIRSGQGIRLVTPLLIRTLMKMGMRQKAEEYLRNALSLLPNEQKLLRLQEQFESREINETLTTKTGKVMKAIRNLEGNLYGYVLPNGENKEIYFSQDQVVPELLPDLVEGMTVMIDVEYTKRGPKAKLVWGYNPEDEDVKDGI